MTLLRTTHQKSNGLRAGAPQEGPAAGDERKTQLEAGEVRYYKARILPEGMTHG